MAVGVDACVSRETEHGFGVRAKGTWSISQEISQGGCSGKNQSHCPVYCSCADGKLQAVAQGFCNKQDEAQIDLSPREVSAFCTGQPLFIGRCWKIATNYFFNLDL